MCCSSRWLLVSSAVSPPTAQQADLVCWGTMQTNPVPTTANTYRHLCAQSGEELDSGAIKDKASKINYLDKIVALVGICSGHDIDVRPSKVVAGLEPEGTNALLTVRR